PDFALSGFSDVLPGTRHDDAGRQLRKQAGDLAGILSADGAMTGLPTLRGGDSKKPDMPYKPDDSWYGLPEGKLDGDDDPGDDGDGGPGTTGQTGTTGGMDPSELHQWGEPPTPAPAAPAGATAGVGSQPPDDPIPVPGSPNPEGAGEDSRIRVFKEAKQ